MFGQLLDYSSTRTQSEVQGASRDRTPEELAPSFVTWVMKMARMPVRGAGFNKLASVSA
jgi:hypothetical protein